LTLAVTAWFPASGQSVVSTHSGVIYFFEGSVFIEDQPLEQKFGRFPNIGEGRDLRTAQGRAEVLLTPGVFLRIGDNSAIRMLSNKLSDTQVALLGGSAILESKEAGTGSPVTLTYKNWQVRVPEPGVYRIDSEPPQLRVYKGKVEVSTEGVATPAVAVKEGETLPLQAILVAERPAEGGSDEFKNWAVNRSQAISADNAIAAEIVDDPSQIDNTGLASGGFSYFPMTGIPSLGLTNPYGLSFWSPYQSALSSLYLAPYAYGSLYPGWPTGLRFYPRRVLAPSRVGVGLRPGGPYMPAPPVTSPARIPPYHPAPHVGIGTHAGAHR
jgi:hypothetical protein